MVLQGGVTALCPRCTVHSRKRLGAILRPCIHSIGLEPARYLPSRSPYLSRKSTPKETNSSSLSWPAMIFNSNLFINKVKKPIFWIKFQRGMASRDAKKLFSSRKQLSQLFHPKVHSEGKDRCIWTDEFRRCYQQLARLFLFVCEAYNLVSGGRV